MMENSQQRVEEYCEQWCSTRPEFFFVNLIFIVILNNYYYQCLEKMYQFFTSQSYNLRHCTVLWNSENWFMGFHGYWIK